VDRRKGPGVVGQVANAGCAELRRDNYLAGLVDIASPSCFDTPPTLGEGLGIGEGGDNEVAGAVDEANRLLTSLGQAISEGEGIIEPRTTTLPPDR
jgi:hypothetical protein